MFHHYNPDDNIIERLKERKIIKKQFQKDKVITITPNSTNVLHNFILHKNDVSDLRDLHTIMRIKRDE